MPDSQQDLGRDIAMTAGHTRQLLVGRFEVFGDPEIGNDDLGVWVLGLVQDVFGFEVAVHNVVGVEVCGTGEDLAMGCQVLDLGGSV
jgi:hypothetical protein